MQSNAAEKAEVTLAGLIEKFGKIQEAASADKQHSAAVQALIAQAKLAGLWVERQEAQNTNMNYAISDQPMTDEEWVAKHVTEN
jgi:hypothetical protein